MGKLLRFRRRRPPERPERSLFDPVVPTGPDDRKPARSPVSDASPLLPPPSDALPADLDGRPGVADPEVERRNRLRRRTGGLVFAAVFLGGFVALFIADRGYLDVRRSRRALAELRAEYAQQQERFHELRREVDILKRDPRAIERIAREQLGFVRPGEVTLVLPGDPAEALEPDARSAIVPGASGTTTRGGAVR